MSDYGFDVPEESDTYPGGAARSSGTGKGRFDLISPFALERLAKVYEKGGIARGDRNWESGMPMSRLLDSSCRHLNKRRLGLQDEDHLGQGAWNIFGMMHFEELFRRGLLSDEQVELIMDLPDYLGKLR